jgi:hypothetical protein
MTMCYMFRLISRQQAEYINKIFKLLNCALHEFIYYNIITIANVSHFSSELVQAM